VQSETKALQILPNPDSSTKIRYARSAHQTPEWCLKLINRESITQVFGLTGKAIKKPQSIHPCLKHTSAPRSEFGFQMSLELESVSKYLLWDFARFLSKMIDSRFTSSRSGKMTIQPARAATAPILCRVLRGHQISSSGMSRKVVRHIAFPPPIGIQLFPIGILMQSMTAQFHFRKDVTQNFLDPVNVVVTEHPERKAEIKILIGKDRIAGIVADDMAFYPSIVLFWLKPSENPRRGSHTLVCS
jgi:hypothetical protein